MVCMVEWTPLIADRSRLSPDIAIIGSVTDELWCGVEAQQNLFKRAPFLPGAYSQGPISVF
jgi:hypothetical protein